MPFSTLFSKNISFWRRGCSDYICLYSNQTPLPLFSLCLCPTLLKAKVIVVGGVNRTGQRLKTTPARFFFRCGLSFFRGGGKGWWGFFFYKITITHLICRLAPFWEHRGRGGELAPSRQILESTLQIELLKYYCRLMKYRDCTVNRWY